MKIQINNNQKIRKIDRNRLRQVLRNLAKTAKLPEPPLEFKEFSVLLTDNPGIRTINKRFFDSGDTTDVICLDYLPIPGEPGNGRTGEIIVNVQRAVEEAARNKQREESRELALYLAHGCDHLSGKEDNTPEKRKTMRRRELAWLRKDSINNLLSDLLTDR